MVSQNNPKIESGWGFFFKGGVGGGGEGGEEVRGSGMKVEGRWWGEKGQQQMSLGGTFSLTNFSLVFRPLSDLKHQPEIYLFLLSKQKGVFPTLN